MKIAFIGGGNMGTAMLASLLEKGLARPEDITVNDIIESRLQYLKDKYGISVTTDYGQAVSGKEVVILSVKPQNLTEITSGLNGKLKPDQLALSIMAGVTIKSIREGLSHNSIVRVMPNMPAQIGEGMSVWTATREVTEQQKQIAGSILGAVGREIYLDDEKYLNMVTAVSGSGPAYFFYFVEALIEAAVQIGLSSDIAKELVVQTMLGSGHLIRQSEVEPAELRRMVTSKGGTTAAALSVLDEGEFIEIVKNAIKAAYNRAIELGG